MKLATLNVRIKCAAARLPRLSTPWRTTMASELQQLIDSTEFRQYHRALQARPFNLFDVLRNAEYEIRHSNVLAWLLQPDESHGLQDTFLRKFVQYLNEPTEGGNVARLPELSGDEARRIRVERELHDVDVTIFLRKPANVLIAIENKMEELTSAHVKQARYYDRKLRKTYGDQYRIYSVLLTMSRDRRPSEPDLLYASWFRIHEIVLSLLKGARFGSGATSVFVEQYLDIVDRALRPISQQLVVEALEARFRPVLKKLAQQREAGRESLRQEVDAHHEEYGRTIDRLVNHFQQRPMELRAAVRAYLEGEGYTTKMTGRLQGKRRGALWLSFSNESMDSLNEKLNAEGPLGWTMSFMHHEVELGLYFPWKQRLEEERPILDRLQGFMLDNPIDRYRSDRYPLDGRRWFSVYRHALFTGEELATTPWSRIKGEARERMARFLAEDYKTIESYLKCLVFNSRGGA